ncbi:hypothetical protein ACU686_03230 [Yinghuangia aomiensis]
MGRRHRGLRAAQAAEVDGAGAAHFAVFWGFVILGATIVEGYGALFDRDFHIPLIGTMTWLGALEDTFIVAVLVGLVAFSAIRLVQSPRGKAASRGSSARTPLPRGWSSS